MRRTSTLLVILLLIAVGLGGYHAGRRSRPAVGSEEEPAAHSDEHSKEGEIKLDTDSERIGGIKTVAATYGDVVATLEATGEVVAHSNRVVQVSSFVAGRIARLSVNIGDTVKAGQTLAVVESTEVAQARAAYQQAQAELRVAEQKLANVKRLAQAGVFTQKSVDEVRQERDEVASQLAAMRVEYDSELANAEASVKTAQATLDRAENARQLAEQELQRRKALVAAGAVQYKPLEDARREMAEAEKSERQARTALRFAETNLTRTRKLFDIGVRSQRELDEAQAARDAADADLKKAEEQVKIARQVLEREQKIFSERIYAHREVQQAETDLAQAEKVKAEAEAALHQAQRRLALAQSAQKKKALEEMENRLAALESLLRRETSVAQQNLYAHKEVQAAEADVAQAKVKLLAAQNTLRLFRVNPPSAIRHPPSVGVPIIAPISGRILERPINRGQVIQPEDMLFTILDLTTVWVDAKVFEKDIRQVRKGQRVEITATAYPDRVFIGRVNYLSDTLNPEAGRTLTVRCEVPNPQGLLRPEMSVRVKIVIGERRSLVVPLSAVREEEGRWIVHVAEGAGRFTDRFIEKGVTYRGQVEILKGLQAGERVVTEGTFLIKSEEKKDAFEAHGEEEGH
ncbi:MAG: efflux RND transporter periplasmic adaptor subunit [Abditibacteriales bacterium]|nr:efflux RND transporter periplasmic adaptor subunit [Abditibacteriales bacterium]MDW8364908.1 efflux RND transporter periplasmic adaptor subunit [Abditibacteriales bacterium]